MAKQERALKVPDPGFFIERLKRGQEALMLSGSGHDALVGETFLLVNEVLKENQPVQAFGRVKFTQEGQKLQSVQQLGARRKAVDPIMLREFEVRKGPIVVLKFSLVNAFPAPKNITRKVAGRFSGFTSLAESESEEVATVEDNATGNATTVMAIDPAKPAYDVTNVMVFEKLPNLEFDAYRLIK